MPRKRTGNFALLDTAFLADPKFMRLSRRTADPVAFAGCLGVFLMLLTHCRRQKSPVIRWDDWEEYAAQVALLQATGVLTDTGFDPASFEKWAPVYQSPSDRRRAEQSEAQEDEDDDNNESLHEQEHQVRKGTQGNTTSIHISSIPLSSVPKLEPPTRLEPVPAARARPDPAPMESLTDSLSNFDLTDPAEVWAYLFNKPPSKRQRETFLASWIDTEGRQGVIDLLHAAFDLRGAADPRARDPVAWIEAEVHRRKSRRLERSAADQQRRTTAAQRLTEQQEQRRRRAMQVWVARGRDEAELPETPDAVERYLAKYDKENSDAHAANGQHAGRTDTAPDRSQPTPFAAHRATG